MHTQIDSRLILVEPLFGGVNITLASVLIAWLFAILILGSAGVFVTPAGQPPLPILLGVLLPVALFSLVYKSSQAFHTWLLHTDISLITIVMAWRFAGLGFLALYAHGILPGLFAWPAGLWDMAVGITAPWMAISLMRDPTLVSSRTFVYWNWFGLIDLIVAVGLGGAISFFASGVPGEITTAPMARLPLVLIPAYLVPLMAMLHITALLQARHAKP